MEFDYRKLLVAYMTRVMGNESISYLEYAPPFHTAFDDLTDEEKAELSRLAQEAAETL